MHCFRVLWWEVQQVDLRSNQAQELCWVVSALKRLQQHTLRAWQLLIPVGSLIPGAFQEFYLWVRAANFHTLQPINTAFSGLVSKWFTPACSNGWPASGGHVNCQTQRRELGPLSLVHLESPWVQSLCACFTHILPCTPKATQKLLAGKVKQSLCWSLSFTIAAMAWCPEDGFHLSSLWSLETQEFLSTFAQYRLWVS